MIDALLMVLFPSLFVLERKKGIQNSREIIKGW